MESRSTRQEVGGRRREAEGRFVKTNDRYLKCVPEHECRAPPLSDAGRNRREPSNFDSLSNTLIDRSCNISSS